MYIDPKRMDIYSRTHQQKLMGRCAIGVYLTMQTASYGLIHQSFKPDIPLYGTICRTGKEWTVQLKDKTTPTGSTISGNITGYGPFPRDKYPDIPVVDFTGEPFDRCFDGLKLLDGGINQLVKNGEYPVENLMNAYREHGFKVS